MWIKKIPYKTKNYQVAQCVVIFYTIITIIHDRRGTDARGLAKLRQLLLNLIEKQR